MVASDRCTCSGYCVRLARFGSSSSRVTRDGLKSSNAPIGPGRRWNVRRHPPRGDGLLPCRHRVRPGLDLLILAFGVEQPGATRHLASARRTAASTATVATANSRRCIAWSAGGRATSVETTKSTVSSGNIAIPPQRPGVHAGLERSVRALVCFARACEGSAHSSRIARSAAMVLSGRCTPHPAAGKALAGRGSLGLVVAALPRGLASAIVDAVPLPGGDA